MLESIILAWAEGVGDTVLRAQSLSEMSVLLFIPAFITLMLNLGQSKITLKPPGNVLIGQPATEDDLPVWIFHVPNGYLACQLLKSLNFTDVSQSLVASLPIVSSWPQKVSFFESLFSCHKSIHWKHHSYNPKVFFNFKCLSSLDFCFLCKASTHPHWSTFILMHL